MLCITLQGKKGNLVHVSCFLLHGGSCVMVGVGAREGRGWKGCYHRAQGEREA